MFKKIIFYIQILQKKWFAYTPKEMKYFLAIQSNVHLIFKTHLNKKRVNYNILINFKILNKCK